MNLYSIPSLPVYRWVIGKGVLFALLGLLAFDGGLCVTSAFALKLSPSSLAFTAQQNGANPAPQTINLSKSGIGMKTWTVSLSVSWLTVSPTSGTISTETDPIVVGANVAGLGQGSYPASITVTTVGAGGIVKEFVVPVSLTLTTSTSSGTIGSLPTTLAFVGTVGGTNPATQPFALTNTGGGTLSWTLSDNRAWLQLNTASGTTTTETDTISASVTTSGLAAGTYNAIITVKASGSTNSPQQIPVSLKLSVTAANTATLVWKASTDSDLAGYNVYRGTGSGTYGAPLTTLSKTTTNYTATGLQNGTTYFFVITAYDSSGNESTYSNEVSKSIF
jgi:fibronectin type III domain protein/BACON domain-containing protein